MNKPIKAVNKLFHENSISEQASEGELQQSALINHTGVSSSREQSCVERVEKL